MNEKQAFKVMNLILNWIDPNETIAKEDIADFVMLNLINLELGE